MAIAARDGGGSRVGGVDVEVERQGHTIVEGRGADGGVIGDALGQDLEHLFALGFAEVEVKEIFGGCDLVGCECVVSGFGHGGSSGLGFW